MSTSAMPLQFLRRVFHKPTPSRQGAGARNQASLPPSPRKLLALRGQYEPMDGAWHPTPEAIDSPLAALYRIYKYIVLDQDLEIRNELEGFWYHTSWSVREIPDPQDPDPEIYAVLACITALLVTSFNQQIDLGLPRDAPPIIMYEMLDEFEKRPKYSKRNHCGHQGYRVRRLRSELLTGTMIKGTSRSSKISPRTKHRRNAERKTSLFASPASSLHDESQPKGPKIKIPTSGQTGLHFRDSRMDRTPLFEKGLSPGSIINPGWGMYTHLVLSSAD